MRADENVATSVPAIMTEQPDITGFRP